MEVDEQLALLNRYSPILRFDRRELFFPTAVDPYVKASGLFVGGSEVGKPGDVSVNRLDHNLGNDSHLRFVSDEDRRQVVSEEAKRLAGKLLGPRLGRVGYFGRVLDALFLLSILLRPTTPRLTTVAASLKADRRGFHRTHTCYGRVVDVGDWLVLHYSFFYVMNDWRSGYRGLNDHEADWEQAWIFCDPADRQPVWVVASSHDNTGSDLRRHWDDTELQRVDEHPVFYVGAGSHALFFRPGDYISRIDVPSFRWLLRVRSWSRWALRIREEEPERGLGPALGVPFVDAAPGNGIEVEAWDIRHLDEQLDHFGGFRGLWGLDTGDPLNAERAPAGPKFQRSGELRRSWVDPVGFAGLHGTSPPSLADPKISLDNIEAALGYLGAEIRHASRLMPLAARASDRDDLVERSERLSALFQQRAELEDLRLRLQSGSPVGFGIRDHLGYPAVPIAPPKAWGWLLAIWATISIPLLMLAAAAPLLLSDLRASGVLLTLLAGFSLLEQLVRRRFNAAFRLVVLYVAVAVFFAFVGVITLSVYAFGATLAIAAVLLFVGNLGELGAYRRRAERS